MKAVLNKNAKSQRSGAWQVDSLDLRTFEAGLIALGPCVSERRRHVAESLRSSTAYLSSIANRNPPVVQDIGCKYKHFSLTKTID